MAERIEELSATLREEPALERRLQAVRALGETGDARAVPPLFEAVESYDTRLCNAVVEALVRLGGSAVPLICRELRAANPARRLAAVAALGRIRDSQGVGPLCKALRDTDALVAEAAADALGRIGTAEVVAPLCRALQELNWEAGRALGRIENPAAIPALCAELKRRPGYVCIELARALARIAEEHPLPELRPAAALIRKRLARWSQETEGAEESYRRALGTIEAATAWLDPVKDLPVPAGAPLLTAEVLPVPHTETAEPPLKEPDLAEPELL